MSNGVTPLTEEQLKERIKADISFVESAYAIAHPKTAATLERWWQSAPLMSAVVAVLTVLLGLGATIVTNRDAKGREQELARLQQQRQDRLGVVMNLNKLVASVFHGTQDRLQAARGELDALNEKKVDSILTSADHIDVQWREGKESNEFLIAYHYDDTETTNAWHAARDSLQRYVSCAEIAYRKFNGKRAPAATCIKQGEAARVAVKDMWLAFNRWERSKAR